VRFIWPGIEFCKGLVPERVRQQAERSHAISVFEKHGINGAEEKLMGAQFCTRLVNARRAVERALEAERLCARLDLHRQGFTLPYPPPVALPRLPPYHPPRGTRSTLHSGPPAHQEPERGHVLR